MQSFESVRDDSDSFLAYPLSTCKKVDECGAKHQRARTKKKGAEKYAVKYLARMPTGGQECNTGKWFNYDE